jgi:hypothetical protein
MPLADATIRGVERIEMTQVPLHHARQNITSRIFKGIIHNWSSNNSLW